MNKFDKIIMEGMVNTQSMLKARVKVLKLKRDAGFDVNLEIQRAKRFMERHNALVRDWMYWYYDTRNDVTRSSRTPAPPALDAIYEGVEVRITERIPKMVLPRASQIELVIDTPVKKGG